MHEENTWITLTYNNKHLPIDRGLHKPDFRNFMKRYRNALLKGVDKAKAASEPEKYRVRYYQCGEYGDENHRPHHHACIFGQSFRFDQKPWRKSDQGNQLYRSKTLEDLWSCPKCNEPIGTAEIGELTQQSAGYTARYIMKKQIKQAADLHYLDYFTGVIREAPYTTMSTRPGIGRKWIDKFHTEVFPQDRVIVDGKKARPPRYYTTQLEKRDPQAHAELKKKREEDAKKYKHDNTPKRLAIKEEFQTAATTRQKREL